MNTKKIIKNIITSEKKTVNEIEFNISRKIENDFIIKTIHFFNEGTNYQFQEKVKAITLHDFEKYFEASKLKIVNLLGDYNLSTFDENNSDRLILVAQKM